MASNPTAIISAIHSFTLQIRSSGWMAAIEIFYLVLKSTLRTTRHLLNQSRSRALRRLRVHEANSFMLKYLFCISSFIELWQWGRRLSDSVRLQIQRRQQS